MGDLRALDHASPARMPLSASVAGRTEPRISATRPDPLARGALAVAETPSEYVRNACMHWTHWCLKFFMHAAGKYVARIRTYVYCNFVSLVQQGLYVVYIYTTVTPLVLRACLAPSLRLKRN
jgi:hypothetical protein